MAASLLLVGCSGGTPSSAYKHPRDRLFAAVPIFEAVNENFVPCFRTIDGMPDRLPDADCYRFTSPQRMSGVAITGFETGSFYPGRTTLPEPAERSVLWVTLDPRTLPAAIRSSCSQGCAVHLDFVGRRTAVQGSYGHMGLANHIVVIDRVLAADLLE